jgi:hypothetical protein
MKPVYLAMFYAAKWLNLRAYDLACWLYFRLVDEYHLDDETSEQVKEAPPTNAVHIPRKLVH